MRTNDGMGKCTKKMKKEYRDGDTKELGKESKRRRWHFDVSYGTDQRISKRDVKQPIVMCNDDTETREQ